MIEYQVEYKDSIGEWVRTGPAYSAYSDALDRLAFEFKEDPEYTHRIVERRQVETVLATLTTASEVE